MIHAMVYIKNDSSFLAILNNSDFIVEVLIVDDEYQKKHILEMMKGQMHNNIKKIITLADFFENEDMQYLTKDEIEENYNTQVKFYQYLYRFTADLQIVSNAYYCALAFTIKLFKENIIDCVINMNFNHGNCDVLIVNYAINHNIFAYNIEPMLHKNMVVYDNIHNELLSIGSNEKDISSSMFYSVDSNAFDYAGKYVFFKKTIGKLAYLFAGEIGWKFVEGIHRKTFKYKEMFGCKSLIDYCQNYIRLLSARKYLRKFEEAPDYTKPYVFFPLHFEPEATVNGRAVLTNQLNVIRIITQSMPAGWECYVKEHPHQFSVNTHRFNTFLYSAGNFKTKDFYRKLKGINRVKIIEYDVQSSELIKNCSAIAIMSGSVGAEATLFNKPVVVFSGGRTIYKKCKDFYCVESFMECKKAFEKILNNNSPRYDDFDDICKKYLIDDSIDGFKIAIEEIGKDYSLKTKRH